jgi:plastocyanin
MRATRHAALLTLAAAAVGVGGMATTATAATTTKTLRADKNKLAYNVKTITVKPGKVTLKMFNPSSIPHDIAVKGASIKQPVKGKVVGKGKTSTVTVHLRKGTYTFYCSVPGHEQAGMKGKLIVK